MRYKVIWAMAGMTVLWMVIMGGTIALDFDRVQQSNQATSELEWTFISNSSNGGYAEIDVIDGGAHFIGRTRDEIENTIIDEKGRALSDPYDSLEPLGNGYVRFENTPHGAVIADDDKNKRASIGVLNDEGQELPEEEALAILEERGDAGVDSGESASDDVDGEGQNGSRSGAFSDHGRYTVAKDGRKYVGIRDSAGNWIVPPAFDKIKISDNQQYAVIRNGSNIGIAVLGK